MRALGVILAMLCLCIPIRAADRVMVAPTATVERGEYRARDPRSGRELWRTQWVLEQAAKDGRTQIRVQEDGEGYRDTDVPTVWTVRIALDISAGETHFTATREVRDASGHPLEVQQRDFDYAAGSGRVITTDVRTGRTESRSFPLRANSIGVEVLANELRLLPDLPDQQMRFDLVTREGKVFGMLAKIIGRERVDVPAGSFECYRVELAPRGLVGVLADLFMPKMYMWHTVAPPTCGSSFKGWRGARRPGDHSGAHPIHTPSPLETPRRTLFSQQIDAPFFSLPYAMYPGIVRRFSDPAPRFGESLLRGRGSKRMGAMTAPISLLEGSRRERLEMAESKVQKVARQGAARKSIGTCQCGGELMWAQVVLTRPRMMKVCEKCGAFHEKEGA